MVIDCFETPLICYSMILPYFYDKLLLMDVDCEIVIVVCSVGCYCYCCYYILWFCCLLYVEFVLTVTMYDHHMFVPFAVDSDYYHHYYAPYFYYYLYYYYYYYYYALNNNLIADYHLLYLSMTWMYCLNLRNVCAYDMPYVVTNTRHSMVVLFCFKKKTKVFT